MAKRQRIKNQQSRVGAGDKNRKQAGQPDNAQLPAVTAEKREKAPSDTKTRSTLLIACTLAALIVAGFIMTTQTDSQANAPSPREEAIAAVLAEGGLYHADADGLDHRALVASRISHLTETPDVVVIADRSWQLVQQDLRWGKQVFGAYIDALAPADIERILGQLTAADRMPAKLILGIGPDYVIQHDTRITLPSEDSSASARETQKNAQFGLPEIGLAFGSQPIPRPGLTPYDGKLDTLFPDGSVVWSMERSREAQNQNRDQLAERLVESLKQKVKASSFSQIVDTGELIAETKSQGVDVVIALTPLHPAIYGQIYNRQTAFRLHESIEDLLAMARALDVVTLGSFEPFAAGCRDADFATLCVPAPACLSRMLDAGFVVGSSQLDVISRR